MPQVYYIVAGWSVDAAFACAFVCTHSVASLVLYLHISYSWRVCFDLE